MVGLQWCVMMKERGIIRTSWPTWGVIMSDTQAIRVLIAKIGLDGHDRGAKVVVRGLRQEGMQVIYTGIRQSPETVVALAAEEAVDVLGVSILSGAHLELLPKVIDGLKEKNMDKLVVIVGGIIPEEDRLLLETMGVRAVFGPGTSLGEIAGVIRKEVQGQTV